MQAERARDLGPVGLQTRETVLVLVDLARGVIGTREREDFVVLVEEMRLSIYISGFYDIYFFVLQTLMFLTSWIDLSYSILCC